MPTLSLSCSLTNLNVFWQYAAIDFVGFARLVQRFSRLSFGLIAVYCGEMSMGDRGSPLGKMSLGAVGSSRGVAPTGCNPKVGFEPTGREIIKLPPDAIEAGLSVFAAGFGFGHRKTFYKLCIA